MERQDVVHVGLDFGLRKTLLAPPDRVPERRAGLRDVAVGGEVAGVELERRLDGRSPALRVVPREAEHEVQREPPEPVGARQGHGLGGARGRVDAPQHLELARIEALGPHREAVDPGFRPGLEQGRPDRLGIRLERHLGSRLEREVPIQRRPEAAKVAGRERRGCSAPEEHRGEPEVPHTRSPEAGFASHRLEVALDRRRGERPAGEVAVGAAHRTEGNVHVEPGAGLLARAP